MRGINYALLGGNLGKNPEIRYMPDGSKVATFNLAVNRKWRTSDGEIREKTDWFRVVAYKRSADNCEQYLSAGDTVIVTGALTTREWEDRESGQKRRSVEMIARSIEFVRIKKRGSSKEDNQDTREPGTDDVAF